MTTIKQPAGSRLCGAAVAAMATNNTIAHVIENAKGGDECCSRLLWMAAYLNRCGVLMGTFATVADYRTGERMTIDSASTTLALECPMKGRPAVIGVDSETKAGQLHWVYWDGESVRDPNPAAVDQRPLSDYAGHIVDVYPLTFVLDD